MELSVTAQVLIAILPLVAVVSLCFLYFFYMLWEYKKAKIILEKGGTPEKSNFNEKLLLIGIVSLFVGIGLLLFFGLNKNFNDSLLGGIIPFMTGLRIIIHFTVIYKLKK